MNAAPGNIRQVIRQRPFKFPHRDVFLNLFIWYPTDDDRPTELIGQNALFYGTMSGRMHGRSQERILLLYLVMVLAETPFRWGG
jgi:hypothetical protein